MTLADDFLADFDGGGDDIIDLQQKQQKQSSSSSPFLDPSPTITPTPEKQQQHNNHNDENDDNNDNDNKYEFSSLLNPNHPSHHALSSHLHSLDSLFSSSSSDSSSLLSTTLSDTTIGDETVQGRKLHETIVQSNAWLIRINDEIQTVFQHVRHIYACKFPELETHVLNALDFSRVVLRIGHETDLSSIDMSDILPSSIVMIIRVTSSTSTFRATGDYHSQSGLRVRRSVDRAMNGCSNILKLDEMRQQILSFVSASMNFLAPNLSAVVGTEVAARLVGEAGGLTALSKIPSADLQLLGKERRNAFLGTMTASTNGQSDLRYVGCIGDCDLLRDTPPDLRKKIGRMIASKCTLAVRVDMCRTSFDSGGDRAAAGKNFRSQIESAIVKLQEPTQGKQIKPLPAPDSFKKKKRGGKKSQRMKEMTKLSEIQKKKNRLAFGTTAEEEVDQQYGSSSGMGMLGVEGSGTLRLGALTRNTLKGAQIGGGGTKTAATTAGGIGSMSSASIVTTSGTATQMRTGLASSLAFTPVQGIELENPLNAQKRMAQATEPKKRYFSTMSFFKEPQAPAPKKVKSEATSNTSDDQK